jgi:hypothetical protein
VRFESVTAYAFGPFTKGERLEFAPGMTVVYGGNESGKSSWHAALYAGLCGIRRVRGRATIEDDLFRKRHRPWDGGSWEVGTVVVLNDARRIELRHDLDGRVDCQALDLGLGRDCSSEIIHEGSPDGSRWLGLDRHSFLATACVRQAELLVVTANASALRELVQRAADTAGTDATAAAALEQIRTFRSQSVGTDRDNSTRPLRRALDWVDLARTQLERAQREHGLYLELGARADELDQKASTARSQLHLFRARLARRVLVDAARRLDRARQLAADQAAQPPGGDESSRLPPNRRLSARPASPTALLIAGGFAAVLGLAIALLGGPLPGVAVAAVGVVLLLWAATRRGAAVASQDPADLRAAELQGLLDGRTLPDLERESEKLNEEAVRSAAGIDPHEIEGLVLDVDASAQQQRLDDAAGRATAALDQLRGQLEERRRTVASVPGAEEGLSRAAAELERLQRLDRVLSETETVLAAGPGARTSRHCPGACRRRSWRAHRGHGQSLRRCAG